MNLPKNLRTRIAPTPSGYLHIGNAFSFILTWLIARKTNGHLQLRIDDSDTTRAKDEYLQDIFESLEWLGIDYDSGAKNMTDFRHNYSQKKRIPFYNTFLDSLNEKELLYACSCSRAQIRRVSVSGKYLGICRNKKISLDTKNVAWRIQIPYEKQCYIQEFLESEKMIFLNDITGDFVVRRKDNIPAYQIISLAEDMREGINFIVRGRDLMDSTAMQLFLAENLDLTEFHQTVFWHHPLIVNHKNVKMSKSDGDIALKTMRENGVTPAKVYEIVANFLGISSSRNITLVELLENFELNQDLSCSTQNFTVPLG